ncbi:MAG: DUF1684 domain-containing protein [Chloroflexi bacterium]|nr:DUF1684 domain-containing protein [Chloroflexota bacterium]
MNQISAKDIFSLAHWRQTTAEMYTAVRQANEPKAAWQQFVAARNQLFKTHPQSPLTAVQRNNFDQLSYFSYDPAFRVAGSVQDVAQSTEQTIELAADGDFRFRRIAAVQFEVKGVAAQLSLFWIQGYGGGLFLPFKDISNNKDTFGGGRYLFDTIKGADLGFGSQEIILDFNFAYNPSCAYDSHWVCPLSPPENRLSMVIAAGEKKYSG